VFPNQDLIFRCVQIKVQKDRKTERQKDRKTERQKDRKTERQLHNTVKPVLTATSKQRPPVYNGQLEPLILQNCILIHCEKRPLMPLPLNNSHFFGVPREAVVDRFDCNQKTVSTSTKSKIKNCKEI
jgi:hypothetical protein